MIQAVSRRTFLAGASAAVCFPMMAAARLDVALPIVDGHIHLYDPWRPGGVPWPPPDDVVLYRSALPARYQALAQPLGVVAAIAVECSPLLADNDWLLHTAARSPWIVGVIGDLDPADEGFAGQLERLSANPLFRGIRYGNLWGRDLARHVDDPRFLEHLRLLARHDLVLESANPDASLLEALLRVTTRVPDLRVVIDHLPHAGPPVESGAREQYVATVRQLGERPNIFVKGSEILRVVDGFVPVTVSTDQPWLDTLWEVFGEDRLFFGSDWPNSDSMAPLP